MEKNNKLHDYVFHYNEYTELWNAIPRELYNEYWSDNKLDGVMKSKDFAVLAEMIRKNIKL